MSSFDAFRYDGKRVLVVGGATGMGAAAAELAQQAGAEVVVMDYAAVTLEGAVGIHVNLADRASIDTALAQLSGRFDALFSCAGVADGTPGIERINFIGHRYLIDRVLERDMLPPGSAIGMISSAAGLGWEANLTQLAELLEITDWDAAVEWTQRNGKADYMSMKQAMCAYVASQAYPLFKRGIRINAICPGPTDTPLAQANKELWLGFGADYRADVGSAPSTPLRAGVPARVPVQRRRGRDQRPDAHLRSGVPERGSDQRVSGCRPGRPVPVRKDVSAMRVIVVGASTGLGRCIAVGLAQRGAKVVLMARNEQLLAEAAVDAGDNAVAIRCDVTDEVSCRAGIERAVEALGGVDAVLYAAGIGELRRIEELDSATWHRVFDTNVVGASTVTAVALPHLKESAGMIAYLSSVSASLTSPWPGLASYTVTKAALDKLVEAWRSEHPEVGFTRLIVGECGGGEGSAQSQFTAAWDMELAGEMFPTWMARGLLTDKLMDIDHFVEAVESILRCGATTTMPSVAVTPRRHL